MKREQGYYWVKLNNGWRIAEYFDNCWYLAGLEVSYNDYEFEEINETRIKSPDEK